jgi:Helix-turn-helix domain
MFAHEIVQDPTKLLPRWLKVPAAVSYSGLSRAKLYILLASGEIRSASVRIKGKIRGIRVIDRESIDEFLSNNLMGTAWNKSRSRNAGRESKEVN